MVEAARQSQVLVTLMGPLVECYPHVLSGTMYTSAQILKEQLTPKWLGFSGWTANIAMYCRQSGEPYLYLLTGDDNFFFRNIKTVLTEMEATPFGFVVPFDEIEPAKAAAKPFNMSDLELKLSGRSFTVDVDRYGGVPNLRLSNPFPTIGSALVSLNQVQRQFAEAVCGEGEDFKWVMKAASSRGVLGAKIVSYSQEEIQNYFSSHPDVKAVANFCWLKSQHDQLEFSVKTPSRLGVTDGFLRGYVNPPLRDSVPVIDPSYQSSDPHEQELYFSLFPPETRARFERSQEEFKEKKRERQQEIDEDNARIEGIVEDILKVSERYVLKYSNHRRFRAEIREVIRRRYRNLR